MWTRPEDKKATRFCLEGTEKLVGVWTLVALGARALLSCGIVLYIDPRALHSLPLPRILYPTPPYAAAAAEKRQIPQPCQNRRAVVHHNVKM